MALDDIALEELGLAPRWVRKGVAIAAHAGAQDVAADVEPTARAAEAAAAQRTVGPAQEDAVREARAARSQQAARFEAEPASTVEPKPESLQEAKATPAISSDEPPPFTEDDFAWFDAVAEPALPADAPAPPRAPRDDIAALDWDALSERVAGCTRCRLCEKRTNTVFGVGDRQADWMLIGEAPGENEDRQGEPFVGQAGKLLDNMLRALSLERSQNVYIANVIKCRPPGNRNPEPDEVARCEPYLQRQVALVKPKIIVALGRFAAQSLLKTDGSIASLRGRVHQYEGVPVIVTYHPAYLLRSLQDKSKAWADLCLARDTWRGAARVDR